ncbi:tetraspanin-18-like isoform X2 [Stigmatopora argus]
MRTRVEPAVCTHHGSHVECPEHYQPTTRYYKKKIRTQTTGDCLSCIKYVMLILNVFFIVAGVFFVFAGLMFIVGDSALATILHLTELLTQSIYFVLATGVALFILGFVGCCGTHRNNRVLLIIFFMLMCVVLILEMTGLGVVVSGRAELYEDSLAGLMKLKYSEATDKKYIKAWNAIMRKKECCGIRGDTDFDPTVPHSCCKEEACDPSDAALRNTVGCYDMIYSAAEPVMYIGVAFFILVLIFQIVVMSFAICLFRGLQHI